MNSIYISSSPSRQLRPRNQFGNPTFRDRLWEIKSEGARVRHLMESKNNLIFCYHSWKYNFKAKILYLSLTSVVWLNNETIQLYHPCKMLAWHECSCAKRFVKVMQKHWRYWWVTPATVSGANKTSGVPVTLSREKVNFLLPWCHRLWHNVSIYTSSRDHMID